MRVATARAVRFERGARECHLYLKEESRNPTDSFKARGMAVAVSKAKELGIRKLAAPSAGNAGSALAAYAAAAGLEAHIVMPKDTPRPIVEECRALGADVRLIDGLISDAGRIVRERADSEGWFDVATFREPYRCEGKKTMGYELWEQMERRLPEVIVYPTGGGTGLVGMYKAFQELAEMQLIGATEGVFASPEAAATVAALPHLRARGFIAPETRIVLFITSGGLKYV